MVLRARSHDSLERAEEEGVDVDATVFHTRWVKGDGVADEASGGGRGGG